MVDEIGGFVDGGGESMLCVVVGASEKVYPAAAYAERVKRRGGRVAVVDRHPKVFGRYVLEIRGVEGVRIGSLREVWRR